MFATEFSQYIWRRLVIRTLTAGPHEVSVGHGEAGVRIDAFFLTLEEGEIPTGTGQ